MDPPASAEVPGIVDVELIDVDLTGDTRHTKTVESFEVLDVSVVRNWGG